MKAILQKELNSFFTSLIAYVTISFFILITGLWIWVFPQTNPLLTGYADLNPFFDISPYLFIFLVPAITMRTFSEEKKLGTIESLLISPINVFQFIMGKYIAVICILFITLSLTITYYITLYYLGAPTGNIDTAGVIGAYLGLWLLGATFAAIGLAASAITENQIVAFIVGVFLCFLLYFGFDAWSLLQSWKVYALFMAQIGIAYHYDALQKGVIDARDLMYFFSVISIALLATKSCLVYQKK